MTQNVIVPSFDVAPETVVGGTPQSAFTFEFPFWSADDILVYVDDVLVDAADYTVAGLALQDGEAVEGGFGSGTVMFDTAVSDCTVKIDRMVVGDRETAFSKSSPLDMRALNGDLNRMTARQQDLKRLFEATDAGSAGVSAAAAETAASRAEAAEASITADTAQVSSDAATSTSARVAAAASAVSAEASATAASLSALASDYYAAATANVPRGIMSTSGLTAGSGGTNGTFALTYSGGNFSVNPTGTFTVSGGALTAVTITGPGLYIGASPTAPTATFTNSAGLTGAAVTLVADFRITSGNGYWTDHASDTTKIQHFRNSAGTAAISTGITLPKSLLDTSTDVWLEVVTPYGCTAGSVTAGSGGTNGTFALAFTGGNFATNPTGTFTVAGGALTAVTLATAGRYLGSSPTAPTPSFAASAGLTGAACTLTAALIATTANNYFLRPVRSDITLTGGFTQYRFHWAAPLANISGSYNVEILQYSGAAFSGLVNLKAADGASQIGDGEVSQYGILSAQRNPSSGSDFPGAVNQFRLIAPPDVTRARLSVMAFAADNDAPTVEDPLYGIRQTDKTWLIKARLVSGTTRNDSIHTIKLYNLGVADSQGVLQNAYNWSWNSQWLLHKGRRFDYANLSSTEIGGGAFAGVQHSTPELAFRVGPMSETNLNALDGGSHPVHDFCGYGHGLIEYVSSTFTVDGAGSYDASPVSTEFRGSCAVSAVLLNVYRPYIGATADKASRWLGQSEIVYRIGHCLAFDAGSAAITAGQTVTGATSGATGVVKDNPVNGQTGTTGGGNLTGFLMLGSITGTFQDNENLQVGGATKAVVNGALKSGMTVTTTHWIGRSLYFDAGSAAIVEGDTVTGGTSGATGIVVRNPTSGQTGSTGGGNLTGCLFLKTITGTWQDNEAIRVGGVTKATVNGTLGGAISLQNAYGPMMPTTVVDRAKVPGYAEVTVGLQGDEQHPTALSNNTWPTADRVALWHSDDPDVLIEILVPNGPISPPGNFTECTTSKVFVQDRAEGVRKVYFNARSGASVSLYEGAYTTEQTYRFRIGSPV
jgi:hypothetical protein